MIKSHYFLAAVAFYIAAYCAASTADLATTSLAVGVGGVEGNAFVNENGRYLPVTAWAITAVGGVMTTTLFAFGLYKSAAVERRWLERPMLSFTRTFFFRFWAVSLRDRAPLHAVSYAVAFVVLRLLAALNNVAIYLGWPAPLGTLVGYVAASTSAVLGFLLVLIPLYYGLSLLMAPLSVVILKAMRQRLSFTVPP